MNALRIILTVSLKMSSITDVNLLLNVEFLF